MLNVDTKVFTLSHINDGYLKPPEVCGSVSKIVDVLKHELAIIDGFEMSDDVADVMRRNIAHSFKTGAKPFTMVIKDNTDTKHLFRVDKQTIKIGVNLK